MSYLQFAKTIFTSLFKKPYTGNYPFEAKEYPDKMRGKVLINIEDCIMCGMCMRKCPADAITVDRTAKTWTLNPFSCVQCQACVDSCPKKCLHMDKHYTDPAYAKTNVVVHHA